jgi:hypothetical protein
MNLQQFRQQERSRLVGTGFRFCDDDHAALAEVEGLYEAVRPEWEELAAKGEQALPLSGVTASTTDDPSQSIRKPIPNCFA